MSEQTEFQRLANGPLSAWAFRITVSLLSGVILYTVQNSLAVLKEMRTEITELKVRAEIQQTKTPIQDQKILDLEQRMREMERRR